MENKNIEISRLKNRIRVLESENKELRKSILDALTNTKLMLNARSFKLIHLLGRLKNQFITGSKDEKKKFLHWLCKRSDTYTDGDHRFQPLYSIYDPLNNIINQGLYIGKSAISRTIDNSLSSKVNFHPDNFFSVPYKNFDVFFFSIIDYRFRFQRPQQFAKRFATHGHRTFYFNANLSEEQISLVEENLFEISLQHSEASSIYESDWSDNLDSLFEKLDEVINLFKIRDCIVIIEYPNWIQAALYLREKYGFKIVTDYLDDFTGFLNPEEKLIESNCEKMLSVSDGIVCSSIFLSNIASKYAKCNPVIIRNGTEFNHFNTAIKKKTESRKKILGYYGAIAHWFDVEKIEYLSKNLKDVEIHLIGAVTENQKILEKLQNVTLLGEKSYGELPKYLVNFDVCLIPFRTDIDLIKATNPVKFYEYLSAGKKIVATQIPELEIYQDKFVYLANDNAKFLDYVKLCLEGQDELQSSAESIEFAKHQDWDQRFEELCKYIKDVVPSVEVIILTYNGLDVNKLCLESILNKTAYPNFKITIVDNNSTDGTKEWLENSKILRDKRIKIVFNDQNLGFAAGNNIAFRKSKADYIILLNNDTIVTRGWMTNLVKHLENDPGLGMCGPVTNAIGNEARIPVNYSSQEELDLFADKYTFKNMGNQWKDPRVLALFCTAIRKDITAQCGFLDEQYTVGMFEDDDYAESVRKYGYRLTIAEDSFVHHFENFSFNQLDKKLKNDLSLKNKSLYEEKWKKLWLPHIYRPEITPETLSGGRINET
ncbi:MAG: glycosyltransferase [Anaerolineaceae bacterium]|nr:glycosyltransferase [Anaerolineaceae bacterium]